MLIAREQAARLGQEAVAILQAGFYRTATDKVVKLHALVRKSVEGTRSYPPDAHLPSIVPGEKQTRLEVENETTLAAARRLVEGGPRPVALNFASAKHPGGGFLTGARAQEESLARSSGLYACLNGNAMYSFHRSQNDPMYSSYAIWSPDVPVFRTDEGLLLDRPYLCSFITSPAVNAKVVLARNPSRGPAIRQAMKERIRKVLTVAAVHGHETVILGAWGCGAFGNDTPEIAALFQEALAGSFRGVFDRVVFAITDWSKDSHFIGPFEKVFQDRA